MRDRKSRSLFFYRDKFALFSSVFLGAIPMIKNSLSHLCFALALLVGASSNGVAAQGDVKAEVTNQKFGPWVVTCPTNSDANSPRCSSKISMVDPKRKIEIMSWTLGFNKDGKLLMEIVTPSDVLIESGLAYVVDESKSQTLHYYSCGPSGCLTRLPVSAAAASLLKKAKVVKLSIAATNGKIITLTIKLAQTAEALSAIGYAN